MKKQFTVIALGLFLTTKGLAQSSEIYHRGWIDLNKNHLKDIYEDPGQPIDKRITDLLSRMTLEEKTCQTAPYMVMEGY